MAITREKSTGYSEEEVITKDLHVRLWSREDFFEEVLFELKNEQGIIAGVGCRTFKREILQRFRA